MTTDAVLFERLTLHGWRQFDDVDIQIHPRLTVLTGANGSGKSTIMAILSRHFGYQFPLLATPQFDSHGRFRYLPGIFRSVGERLGVLKPAEPHLVGSLRYTTGQEVPISVPSSDSVQYNLEIRGKVKVAGIQIHSHQPISVYQTVSQIPANITTAQLAFEQYYGEIISRTSGGYSQFSPIYKMKEAILAMAVFGEGNGRSQGNIALVEALDGFVSVLRTILPETLGFIDLVVRAPEIVIKTQSGEFIIDSASGGLMTLFDFAWRLHMYSIDRQDFVVTIDEPENHLHPSMQRSLLPRLLAAFPRAQFIIATHSPFMVSSVKDCNVYVLRYRTDDKRHIDGFVPETSLARVSSELLDTVNRSASANEILREVLGVPATVPEWVSNGVEELLDNYRQQPFTSETVAALRKDMEGRGYSDQYPFALSKLTGGK